MINFGRFLTGIAQTHCCLEDALIAPIGLSSLVNLLFCSIWVDNAVLPCNLILVTLLVCGLLLLVLLQLRLELTLQVANLTVLGNISA